MTGTRTSVYLDDELVRAAKSLDMNISAVLQGALREAIDRELEVMLVAGARRQESRIRMGSIQVMRRRKSQVWVNPIIDFSHADKEDLIESAGLPRNPVVDALHMSGECLCGCFANMPESGELGQIGFFYPEVRAQIRALEQEVFNAGAWPNWGQFRTPGYEKQGTLQPWLPLCQDCPTRWEVAL